ncbi:hypothetical protein C8J56DRAFT_1125001 [Mycena floridula]|nr:hypothetical protein C8J56DRAFT_1125001 [Mycena floridula]
MSWTVFGTQTLRNGYQRRVFVVQNDTPQLVRANPCLGGIFIGPPFRSLAPEVLRIPPNPNPVWRLLSISHPPSTSWLEYETEFRSLELPPGLKRPPLSQGFSRFTGPITEIQEQLLSLSTSPLDDIDFATFLATGSLSVSDDPGLSENQGDLSSRTSLRPGPMSLVEIAASAKVVILDFFKLQPGPEQQPSGQIIPGGLGPIFRCYNRCRQGLYLQWSDSFHSPPRPANLQLWLTTAEYHRPALEQHFSAFLDIIKCNHDMPELVILAIFRFPPPGGQIFDLPLFSGRLQR